MPEPREVYMARRDRWLPRAVASLVVGGLFVVGLLSSIAYVPAGHVGVLSLFGQVTGEVLPEGTHLISPFKTNNRLPIRTQEIKETASVPSEEGLIITLDTSLLFHVDPQKASEVWRTIGPDYVNVMIEPNLRSAIRSATAAHNANALYTGAREEVALQVQ